MAIPTQLAGELATLKAGAPGSAPTDFVFATRTGRPLAQRNVLRALRAAQRNAVDAPGAYLTRRGVRPAARPNRGARPTRYGPSLL